MFCRNCGKEVSDEAIMCISCGVPPKNGKNYCQNCGEPTDPNAVVCIKCGVQLATTGTKSAKSKLAAGLIGIFLGCLGIHNFYLGYMGKAIAQLLITVLSFGFLSFVSGIWGLIEGIMILTGSIDKDADGNPLKE